jgi:hypothetical protein
VVARNGIEPRTPAFSGPPFNSVIGLKSICVVANTELANLGLLYYLVLGGMFP